ncbi:MAG TPA: response regulator [Nitrosopumilus sp.]|nr:response regulator [Nitrosopumilus sp.]
MSIGEHEIVPEASDGAEAVDLYQKHNPDLLLLDLAMPKKDGLTVVKEVIAYDPNAKIILVTASDDQKTIQQCLDSGAISHISKPFDFNLILKMISNILEK